jgi:hypothetical protein
MVKFIENLTLLRSRSKAHAAVESLLEEVLLEEVQQNLVIFVDEIDQVLRQNFSLDDFLVLSAPKILRAVALSPEIEFTGLPHSSNLAGFVKNYPKDGSVTKYYQYLLPTNVVFIG